MAEQPQRMTDLAVQHAEEDARLALLGVPPPPSALPPEPLATLPDPVVTPGPKITDGTPGIALPQWPPRPEHGAIPLPDDYPADQFPALRIVPPTAPTAAPAAKVKFLVVKPGRITWGGYGTYLSMGVIVDPAHYGGMEAIERFRGQGVGLEPIDA